MRPAGARGRRALAAACLGFLVAVEVSAGEGGVPAEPRYLIHRVGAVEGFNLRRDAFLRAALLVQRLGSPWTLVLPPFPRLRHWRDATTAAGARASWATYFDLAELARVLPLLEWKDFAARHDATIDEAWYLVDAPPAASGGSVIAVRDCAALSDLAGRYRRDGTRGLVTDLGGPRGARVRALDCRGVFAPFTAMVPELRRSTAGAILIDRFERLFWDPAEYDGAAYWKLRRHMVFARRLRTEAARWRTATFDDEPYLAVHLRRGDFVIPERPQPSLDDVAAQVRRMRDRLGLRRVFVATDAAPDEVAALRQRLPFERYAAPTTGVWLDGEVAIVDQVIATAAATFIGTAGSTFSTVIMEERTLAGRPAESTYNVLCRGATGAQGVRTFACEQPAARKIPAGA